MPSISVNELSLEFRLRRSERAKRLHIVFQEQAFEVVAPRRISNHVILSFLWQKRRWMARAYERHQKTTESVPVMFYFNNLLLFRGKQWPLSIQYGTVFDVAVLEEGLLCTLPATTRKPLQSWLVEWLYGQTQQIIQSTVQAICPLLGRFPKKISVKQQKTRWGSCGINDGIHINWLLIFAPPGVLEYVIVHELCHLIHRNHSKRFWQAVARYCPDYQTQRNWLRKWGDGLMNIQ
jgi:hypothetical protein